MERTSLLRCFIATKIIREQNDMATLCDQDFDVVHRSMLLGGLPFEVFEMVLGKAVVVDYPRGRLLFQQGANAEKIYLILEGWVKIFRNNADGEQTVISVFTPGETIAEAAIFLGSTYPASAEVVEGARLLEIPAHIFLEVLRKDTDLAFKMLGNMSIRLCSLVRHIEQIQTRSTPQRLGIFLLNMCDETKGAAMISLPYDKSLIAARLGMKPESFSRALAKLREFGVTSKGPVISIKDICKLKEFARDEA